MSAQCSYNGVTLVPANSSVILPLDISGALNNDLGNIDQCVAAVTLSFNHPRLSFFNIKLVSPIGDTVTLVSGEGGVFNPTFFSAWDVTFVPCSQAALPDAGFDPFFDNTASWGILSSYIGQYYPSDGCLEHFNRGGVNGQWSLVLENNSLTDDVGRLRGFTIFFCDGTQINCIFCEAAQSEIRLNNSSYCENSPNLALSINRTFTGPVPDTNRFIYEYFVLGNNVLLDRVVDPDLTSFPPGLYSVCGISFAAEDASALPDVGSIMNIDLFRSDLLSNKENICARISNCIPVEIHPKLDTSFLTKTLCRGDSILIGSQYYKSSGIFTETFFRPGQCDSVIVLDLTVLDFEVLNNEVFLLDCGSDITSIDGSDYIIASEFIKSSIGYLWISDNGVDTLSYSSVLEVGVAGTYFLHIVSDLTDLHCQFIFPFTFERPDQIIPEITPLSEACINSILDIGFTIPIPESSFSWDIVPAQPIIGPVDTGEISVLFTSSGITTICATIESGCIRDTTVCQTIFIVEPTKAEFSVDPTTCGLSVSVGIEDILLDSIQILSGNGFIVDFFYEDSSLEVEVSSSGVYSFVIYWNDGTCHVKDTLSLEFKDLPVVSLTLDSIIDCNLKNYLLLVESDISGILSFSISGSVFDYTVEPGLSSFDITGNLLDGLNIIQDFFFASDLDDCGLMVDSVFMINYHEQIPSVDAVTVCNNSIGNNLSIIDFNLILNTGEIVSVTSMDFPEINFDPVFDFEGFQPGIYTFNILVFLSDECPEFNISVLIKISDCGCPNLLIPSEGLVFCVNSEFDLSSLIDNSSDIDWLVLESPIGSEYNIIENTFSILNAIGGIYTLGFYSTDTERCVDTTLFSVEALELFNPGIVESDTIVLCLNDETLFVDLFELLEGHTSGGYWKFGDKIPTSIFIEPYFGILEIAPGTQESIEVIYSMLGDEEDLCGGNRTSIHLKISHFKLNELEKEAVLSCNEIWREFDLSVILNGSSELISFDFILERGTFNYNDTEGTLLLGGDSQLLVIVSNDQTSCNDSIRMITSFDFPPITAVRFDLLIPTCYEEDEVGSVNVIEVSGGQGIYTVFVLDELNNKEMGLDSLLEGSYLLVVQDENGCESSTKFSIDLPEIVFIQIIDDFNGDIGQSVEFQLTSSIPEDQIQNINWFKDGLLFGENTFLISSQIDQSTVIKAYVEDINGCLYSDSIRLQIAQDQFFYLPNAFSPNGDQVNDILYVYPIFSNLTILSWEIFNRWGGKVYTSSNFNPSINFIGWDGTFLGNLMDPGVYISHIKFQLQDGTTGHFSSEINLLR